MTHWPCHHKLTNIWFKVRLIIYTLLMEICVSVILDFNWYVKQDIERTVDIIISYELCQIILYSISIRCRRKLEWCTTTITIRDRQYRWMWSGNIHSARFTLIAFLIIIYSFFISHSLWSQDIDISTRQILFRLMDGVIWKLINSFYKVTWPFVIFFFCLSSCVLLKHLNSVSVLS